MNIESVFDRPSPTFSRPGNVMNSTRYVLQVRLTSNFARATSCHYNQSSPDRSRNQIRTKDNIEATMGSFLRPEVQTSYIERPPQTDDPFHDGAVQGSTRHEPRPNYTVFKRCARTERIIEEEQDMDTESIDNCRL